MANDSRAELPPAARQTTSARQWWIRLTQIAITLFALACIGWLLPWRDRVRLSDGTQHTVTGREADRIAILGSPGAAFTHWIPESSVHEFEPGALSLMARIRLSWLWGYVLCALGIAVSLIARWFALLHALDMHTSVRWCSVIWARSQVVNALPLSQIGGDLYRIVHLRAHVGGSATAAGVILTERLLGLIALTVAASSGLLLARDTALAGVRAAFVGMAPIGVGLAALMYGLRGPVLRGFRRATTRFSAVERAVLPLQMLTRLRLRLILSLVLSILVQLLASLSFVAIDRALGFMTPAWCYMVAVPLVTLAQFLPIHIAGIGVLEGGLWLVLTHYSDRTLTEVAAICAMTRILALLWLAILALSLALSPGSPFGISRDGHLTSREASSAAHDLPALSTQYAPSASCGAATETGCRAHRRVPTTARSGVP